MIRVRSAVGWLALACSTAACTRQVSLTSDAPIITRYGQAPCIPSSPDPSTRTPGRKWDYTLSLRDGLNVTISGAQAPGERITVSYPTMGRTLVAAYVGDYIYSTDVRVDAENELLYVKMDGLAGGMTRQTWLFEYDLRKQLLVAGVQVASSPLPPQCPDTIQ